MIAVKLILKLFDVEALLPGTNCELGATLDLAQAGLLATGGVHSTTLTRFCSPS